MFFSKDLLADEEAPQGVSSLTVQKRELQDLLSSRAWAQLVGVVQEQADALQRKVVFGPITCTGDIYEMERAKGQLLGLVSLTNTAQTMLEDLEHSLKLLETKE